MKNRLRTLGKHASWMLAVLAVCGSTTSCKDEYVLDDEKPSFLGSSIYESLKSKGNFTNYLRLVGDADVNPQGQRPLSEVLSRTGSKTVFVADDAAWAEFFALNATLPATDPWHNATSYENLSYSQKKMLIHGSMLNNAIVMENLASEQGTDGAMNRGMFLRRNTDLVPTDSITLIKPEGLPYHLDGAEEIDQWWRFREEGRRDNVAPDIYLVCDSTPSMMVAFTNQYMKNNNITDEDFHYATGMERVTEDVHINNAKILQQDQACENGYINIVDRVLKPLGNIAEELQKNPNTQIFSHMLERWSVPFYNATVTSAYTDIMISRGIEWKDSIFSKRYFSDMSYAHTGLTKDPRGKTFVNSKDAILKFDPSWNAYYNESKNPMYDMAAMYVPVDDALWTYFTTPHKYGWDLINTYYLKTGTPDEITYEAPDRNNLETLYKQIDCIPVSTLNALINVIMMKSFANSVPSKMEQLRNDAQEQLFEEKDKENIVGSIIANNGVVYLMNKVYGPADFTSVAAPAHITKTNLIMKWAIYNGSKESDANKMQLNYYAYLKAMKSRFAIFMPSDKALTYLYDVLSFTSKKPRIMSLSYNAKNAELPVKGSEVKYDPQTGVIDGTSFTSTNSESVQEAEIVNRLKDVLESHTIVLEGDLALSENGIDTDVNNFYLAKNGAPVKVTRENGHVVSVQGGFQVENEINGIEGSVINTIDYTDAKGIQRCKVEDGQTYKKENGTTYILDSPITNTSKSVRAQLESHESFDNFMSLCTPEQKHIDMIVGCGLVDKSQFKTETSQKIQRKKYLVFVETLGSGSTIQYAPDENVSFLSSNNYTFFVPNNEAVQNAIDCGLPTWESIYEDYAASIDPELKTLTTHADSARIQAKLVFLANFIRYHFADNSVFVDNSSVPETLSETFSFNKETSNFIRVGVKRTSGTPGTLSVRDENGGKWMDINNSNCNIMARDIFSNKKIKTQNKLGAAIIKSSSFITMHEIPGVLNHTVIPTKADGTLDYSALFNDEAAVKRYLKKFEIK